MKTNIVERLKTLARKHNSPIMETYTPVSPGERHFWELHKHVNSDLVQDHKKDVPTSDDAVFKATNVAGPATRKADKAINPDDKPGSANHVG